MILASVRGVPAPVSAVRVAGMPPLHQLTVSARDGGKSGRCSCRGWRTNAATSEDVTTAFLAHLNESAVLVDLSSALELPASSDVAMRGERSTRAAGSSRFPAGLSSSPAALPLSP